MSKYLDMWLYIWLRTEKTRSGIRLGKGIQPLTENLQYVSIRRRLWVFLFLRSSSEYTKLCTGRHAVILEFLFTAHHMTED